MTYLHIENSALVKINTDGFIKKRGIEETAPEKRILSSHSNEENEIEM